MSNAETKPQNVRLPQELEGVARSFHARRVTTETMLDLFAQVRANSIGDLPFDNLANTILERAPLRVAIRSRETSWRAALRYIGRVGSVTDAYYKNRTFIDPVLDQKTLEEVTRAS